MDTQSVWKIQRRPNAHPPPRKVEPPVPRIKPAMVQNREKRGGDAKGSSYIYTAEEIE